MRGGAAAVSWSGAREIAPPAAASATAVAQRAHLLLHHLLDRLLDGGLLGGLQQEGRRREGSVTLWWPSHFKTHLDTACHWLSLPAYFCPRPAARTFFSASLSLKEALTFTSLPAAARRFSCRASVFSKPAGTL